MEFVNLEHIDFDTLFQGFDRAFSDYDIHFEKDEVRSMLKRRGYNPRLSFAAFDKGEMVAFTLNGTGLFNDTPTAYDTGTGTVKEYRGQGIAGKLFRHSLPHLREAGIRQYLLEVLCNNQKALSVYRRMGFEPTREFDCFRQTVDNIINPKGMNDSCIINPVGVDAIRQLQDFCDFSPSWQNGIDSVGRGASEITCFGAFTEGKPVGYCAFDANTGDLSQIAVKREYRRRGIASGLLQEVTKRMKTDFVKVLNVSSDNQTLPAFLRGRNIVLASKQFEMLLRL